MKFEIDVETIQTLVNVGSEAAGYLMAGSPLGKEIGLRLQLAVSNLLDAVDDATQEASKMAGMKYKVNDVVQISALSPGPYAGEIVLITAVDEAQQSYEFVVPERRGACAEQAIERKIATVDWNRWQRV
jgi:hypothetical protein